MFKAAFIELLGLPNIFFLSVFRSNRTDFPPKIHKYSFYQPCLLDDYEENDEQQQP